MRKDSTFEARVGCNWDPEVGRRSRGARLKGRQDTATRLFLEVMAELVVGGYDEISLRRRPFMDVLADLEAAEAVSKSVSAANVIFKEMFIMESRIESRCQII